jgi:hypothetical protein
MKVKCDACLHVEGNNLIAPSLNVVCKYLILTAIHQTTTYNNLKEQQKMTSNMGQINQ